MHYCIFSYFALRSSLFVLSISKQSYIVGGFSRGGSGGASDIGLGGDSGGALGGGGSGGAGGGSGGVSAVYVVTGGGASTTLKLTVPGFVSAMGGAIGVAGFMNGSSKSSSS
jgi:hypothetical protein